MEVIYTEWFKVKQVYVRELQVKELKYRKAIELLILKQQKPEAQATGFFT